AHDHLEMNLYPRMGNPPYKNYIEWGTDIYKPKETPVKEIERVNPKDRLLWGGLKNLISGVTTVIHHNPWNRFLSSSDFPIRVLKKYAWAHSLGFGKNISKAFPKDLKSPFVIHAAEGVDETAFAEINTLAELGLLKKNSVLVHAVATSRQQIERLRAAQASVVWCPSSNYFLFNKTAPINELKNVVKVAIGSDSTLTGSPTLLDEIRFAAQTGLADSTEIYNQVTINPASIFNLPKPGIEIGKPADLFITAMTQEGYHQNLINTQPASIGMVLVKGEPRLCDESIATVLDLTNHFANVGGKQKWVFTDVQKLKKRIQVVAGKTVESNPLWKLIN
ncbi:MAG TPA: amidohydrolase family protein, partial [Cyclobacteriaceae bacterium]|nr:amidohydrolase family protein [Cyclobacteriaceae bacterium]